MYKRKFQVQLTKTLFLLHTFLLSHICCGGSMILSLTKSMYRCLHLIPDQEYIPCLYLSEESKERWRNTAVFHYVLVPKVGIRRDLYTKCYSAFIVEVITEYPINAGRSNRLTRKTILDASEDASTPLRHFASQRR
jgi:hypothetical protein